MDYSIGKICPYCKTEIKEGEAVKVCPSCGIAHHESCWEENRGCTTFGCSEQNSVQPKEEKAFCAKCGAELPTGAVFCANCGTPAAGSEPNVPQQQNSYASTQQQNPYAPTQQQNPYASSQQQNLYSSSQQQNPYAPSAASVYPGQAYTPAQNKAKPKIDANYIADTIAKKSSSVIAFVGGLFSGLLSIVFGIVCFCLDTGRYVSYETYGGDAYTGIQHAAAGTGNNVEDLAGIVKFGFGALLIVVGIAICCFFIAKIIEAKTKK